MVLFRYKYRNAENAVCSGEIAAANREDVFRRLKASNIRPMFVEVAPGVFNRIKSMGRRWAVIVVLVIVLLAVLGAFLDFLGERRDRLMFEDRAQIYGDPGVIASMSGGAGVFENEGERWLAWYAIPGRVVEKDIPVDDAVLESALKHRVRFSDGDYAEVAKLKRIVNGMKRELREYLADGGTMRGYVRRVYMRQQTEVGIFNRIKDELTGEQDSELWSRRNAELRAMGLPMVQRPSKESEDTPLTAL